MEHVVVHRDERLGADLGREPRSLPFVQVADDAPGFTLRMTTVHREQRHVWLQGTHRRFHALVVDRVARVEDANARGVDHVAEETDRATRQCLAEAVCVVHRDAVARGDRIDREPRGHVTLPRLHAEHPLGRDPHLRDLVHDRRRYDEDGTGRRRRDRGCGQRVEVIEVLVGASGRDRCRSPMTGPCRGRSGVPRAARGTGR